MENLLGKTIDHYRIVSILGEGGMGIVYKAFDTHLERYVAVKMMRPHIYYDKNYFRKFKNEAKHLAQMSHPHIVAVFGFIEHENLLGIVMEYIEGETVSHILQRVGRLTIKEAVHIIKQVLRGMDYAHSIGFIHRDIKPSNIIVAKNGTAKLMDFGIAKNTENYSEGTSTESKAGTLYYLSPEQIKGQKISLRSDIYSIGCTLYEFLTGYPPFYSSNDYDVLENHIHRYPAPASNYNSEIPRELDALILRALSKNPMQRFSSCSEMINALTAMNLYKPVTNVVEYNPPARFDRKARRAGRAGSQPAVRKFTFKRFLAVVILLAGFIGMVYLIYNRVKELSPQQGAVTDTTKMRPVEQFVK